MYNTGAEIATITVAVVVVVVKIVVINNYTSGKIAAIIAALV